MAMIDLTDTERSIIVGALRGRYEDPKDAYILSPAVREIIKKIRKAGY